MKHAREDYQRRIVDTDYLIPEDEPVMLFRAKDKHFVGILRHYETMLCDDPMTRNAPIRIAVTRHCQQAREWQKKNGTKTPDIPAVEG